MVVSPPTVNPALSLTHGKLIELTASIIERLQRLGLLHCFLIVPMRGAPQHLVRDYWRSLEQANRLRFRFGDVLNPTSEYGIAYTYKERNVYAAIGVESGDILAEFTLGQFSGKAAQLHVSVRPGVPSKVSVDLADQVSNMILTSWRDPNNIHEPYIESLFGITPVSNKPACVFVVRAGFTKLGVLPGGTHHLTKIDNAQLTLKTLEDLHYG